MTSRRSVLRFLGYGSAALGAAALLTSGCARFRTDRAEDDYPPIGEFVDVRITEAMPNSLRGKVVTIGETTNLDEASNFGVAGTA